MGIERQIRFETAGTNKSVAQVFFNNYYADSTSTNTSFFEFDNPQYLTYGGTVNYYSQDPYAIFTNIVKPPIVFIFTANTHSLSGNSYFIHEIYRLDFETHRLYSDNQLLNSQMTQNSGIVSNISVNGNTPANTLSRISNNSFLQKSGNNPITQPEKLFDQSLTTRDMGTIQTFFKTPILIITASTSAVTKGYYKLNLTQYSKVIGSYKKELFLDKAQYFINTKIVYDLNLNKNYLDYQDITRSVKAIPKPWNDKITIYSNNTPQQIIQDGPYAGISIVGNFFTYFTIPDKPVLDYPIMSGNLSTFTPEFIWSNGDNADSFVVQINYNTSDIGFTGTNIVNYPIDKSDKNSKIITYADMMDSSQISTQKTVYTAQISTKSNSSFLYRVGNSKEIIDIFNVRRNVVTFSDYYSAKSQIEPIKTYVLTESDSPYIIDISGFIVPPSLDYETDIYQYTLSGKVRGSIVIGATLTLTFPDNSLQTALTDSLGNFSFSGLNIGNYTLTTIYRGYEQDIRTISINSDTLLDFKINLLWGDDFDTWASKASDNYYT